MNKPIPLHQRRRRTMALLASALLGVATCSYGSLVAQPVAAPAKYMLMKIRLTVDGQTAIASLYDNATARDFASMLPLILTMEDYDSIERVSNLSRKLSTQGAPAGMTPEAGELTHYAPWGNLAIFIEPRSYSRSLLPLGKVDEGLSILARPGPYKLRIERVTP